MELFGAWSKVVADFGGLLTGFPPILLPEASQTKNQQESGMVLYEYCCQERLDKEVHLFAGFWGCFWLLFFGFGFGLVLICLLCLLFCYIFFCFVLLFLFDLQ